MMGTKKMEFNYCDQLIDDFLKSVKTPRVKKNERYVTGVDLGTACVVVCVLNQLGEPVAGAYRYADVVRDGMLVDYIGAVHIVQEMITDIEKKLKTTLETGAVAIPPGTEKLDGGAVKNVAESAGLEVIQMLDEPTAANHVLKIQNGAIVDIGGGTTGISILKDGKVVYVNDEATGGTHFSLVVSGAYQLSYEKAELYKRDGKNHKELMGVLEPVIDKVASIISKHITGYNVEELILVGGSACLDGIEDIIEKRTGVPTRKPKNPMFVTPLGIALSCLGE